MIIYLILIFKSPEKSSLDRDVFTDTRSFQTFFDILRRRYLLNDIDQEVCKIRKYSANIQKLSKLIFKTRDLPTLVKSFKNFKPRITFQVIPNFSPSIQLRFKAIPSISDPIARNNITIKRLSILHCTNLTFRLCVKVASMRN